MQRASQRWRWLAALNDADVLGVDRGSLFGFFLRQSLFLSILPKAEPQIAFELLQMRLWRTTC